jgi:rRNA maturation protein Nop10
MDALAVFVVAAFLLGLLWLGFAAAAIRLAVRRGGRPFQWSLLGLLLGPVGLCLALWLARACPSCGAPVLRDVRTCPRCGDRVPAQDPKDNPRGPLWSYRRNW